MIRRLIWSVVLWWNGGAAWGRKAADERLHPKSPPQTPAPPHIR